MLDIETCAVLLIVDVQKGFDEPHWGANRNNPAAEINIARLLNAWRATGRPVVHVRHDSTEADSPLRPESRGNEFKEEVTPATNEHIESKCVNSAFIGTSLEDYLRKNGFNTLVIVGLTTDHCISTTTRMAGNLGFRTFVVADATATFDRRSFDGKLFPASDVHEMALASLHREFATVLNTDDVLEVVNSVYAVHQK